MSIWSRLINADHPESPQLLTVLLAAVVLPSVCAGIGGACIVRIARTGDLGSGACWALGLSTITLAVLAGFADRIKALGALRGPGNAGGDQ
nr:hypothetical protein [uncultured Holophaga sp.]